jgi:hemoglobin
MKILPAIIAAALLVSCSSMEPVPAVKYKDGEQPVPADYKTWPKFLSGIQRPDAKQVRDIYVSPKGYSSAKGQPFPNGTTFVMENYAAAANPDGTLQKGADGKLVKANLLRVFVMGKGDGWGASAPADLRNGDWVYASYGADGKATADSLIPCRACHLPLDKKDFVHRYDEYFETRGGY